MSSIHSDAFKESSKGSFGYSDWFLYKYMFSHAGPYKKELLTVAGYMLFFSLSTVLGPLILLTAVDRFSTDQTISFGINVIDNFTVTIINFLRSMVTVNDIWYEVFVAAFYYLFDWQHGDRASCAFLFLLTLFAS